MVSIGKQSEDKFVLLGSYSCVFFSLTQKNLNMLKLFAKGKSEAIDTLLDRYSDLLCKHK